MNKLICATVLSLLLFSCEQTNPDKDKARIEAICDKFMEAFRDEKVSDAIQILKQNSVMSPASLDSLQGNITSQFNNAILPNYGKIKSYEFIADRKVKDFISKRFYILRFEKYYLKVDFTLYKGDNKWMITGFNYNDDLTELLF